MAPTVLPSIPRPEHPRPQFYRESWRNLNGTWQFDFDFGDSKKAQGWAGKDSLPLEITVPFCPESMLSGQGYTDFMDAVWYRREISLSGEELAGRVLLHFGAVDYHCEVFVNGQAVGSHDGGYTSFTVDVTAAAHPGVNAITVYASDHLRTGKQPSGKQSHQFGSYGCFYTRTTGIWQTVWLEFVPSTYLSSLEAIPDPDNSCVHLRAFTNQPASGMKVAAKAALGGKVVGEAAAACTGACTSFVLPLSEAALWEPGSPALYDLSLTLETAGGETADTVSSYFGLRKVELRDGAILLNGKPVFQRLVLDQGFYPDGIYTAPSDEALKQDIQLSMDMGFNGARLHEKVFEERFLYWADRMGYLVWGEFPNWGLDISEADALCTVLPQWLEEVKRDFNHPALVGWCPFNETWDFNGRCQDGRVLSGVYYATKAADPTRPVIDTSGNFHVVTDIYDVHDYEQDPEVFYKRYAGTQEPYENYPDRQQYGGQPYFVSEYGGTWWNAQEAQVQRVRMENGEGGLTGWGYGARPLTEEEAGSRIAGLTKALLDDPKMCAFCYTQLTDVEQEQNGLYNYDRSPKFSPEVYKAIKEGFSAPAAIEKAVQP